MPTPRTASPRRRPVPPVVLTRVSLSCAANIFVGRAGHGEPDVTAVASLDRMTPFARRERTALRDTLRATGPDAPTLCEGWTARDLAAHVVVREHAPIGALGIWARPLAGYTAK